MSYEQGRPGALAARRVLVRTVTVLTVAAGTLAGAPRLRAQTRLSGEVGTEVRGFLEEPSFSGQQFHVASVHLAPRLRVELGDGHALEAEPFVRVITDRSGSPVAYFRTLAWSGAVGALDVRAGIQRLRWDVTSSVSPFDVLNRNDRSFHPISYDRIGSPMLSLHRRTGVGDVDVAMISRVTPGVASRRASRLRGASWVDPERVEYAEGSRRPLQVAMRWSHEVPEGRVGLVYFDGAGMSSSSRKHETPDGSYLVRRYERLEVLGAQLQRGDGDWRLQGEAALRRADREAAHAVAVAGVERIFRPAGAELSVIVEYTWDSRGEGGPSSVEDDVYVEAALVVEGGPLRKISGAAIVDRSNGSSVWTVSITQEIHERWILKVGTWQFSGPDLGPLVDDGYVSVSLKALF